MSALMIDSEEQIDKEALLRRVPLFAGLGEERLAPLAAVSRVCAFPSGDEIIEEGHALADGFLEEEDGLYVLINGTVEVRKGSTSGTDGYLLATLGPGEFFGEMALLDGHPRSASVYAISEALCLILSRSDLHRVLRADPEIALRMLAVLSGRLRGMVETAGRGGESA